VKYVCCITVIYVNHVLWSEVNKLKHEFDVTVILKLFINLTLCKKLLFWPGHRLEEIHLALLSGEVSWDIKASLKILCFFAVLYIWSGRNLSLPASKMCIDKRCTFICYLLNVHTFWKYTMRNSHLCNTVSHIHWPNVLTSKYSKFKWLLGNPVFQVHLEWAVGGAILGS